MPHITVMYPGGLCFQIATRQTETVLRAWFDEVLPGGRVEYPDGQTIWPTISVWPMWAWQTGPPSDPDWLCDSRVLGRAYPFEASDGETGLKALLDLRRALERDLAEMVARDGQ